MLVWRIITCVNRHSVPSGQLRVSLSFNTSSLTSNTPSEEEPERAVRKLKEWRKPPTTDPSIMKMFEPPMQKNQKLVMPRTVFRLPPNELKHWWKSKKVNYEKHAQQFIQRRHETLGCDLAAAHFLVHRGGRVKFFGQSEWITKDEDGKFDLPTTYDPLWQLTDVDASGIALYYEGIENFKNLYRVSWASFRDNPHLNDWCVDKISAHFRNVEHLDISGCKNVTERALEALYRLYNLKTLIVTDWHKVPSFELTCAMLEDCNPNLTIKILDSEEETKEKKEI